MPFKNTIKIMENYWFIVNDEFDLMMKPDFPKSLHAPCLWEQSNITIPIEIRENIYESFYEEYKRNLKAEIYFYGCSFDLYKKTFESRLKDFLLNFPDAKEKDFLIAELETGINSFEFPYISSDLRTKINFSLERRKEFIIEKLHPLGYCVDFYEPDGFQDFEGLTSFQISEYTKINNKNEINLITEPTLKLKGIPNFNLQQRYYIFKKLGFEDKIHLLNTSLASKHKILALLLGISPDNSKKLINNTYKELSLEDKAEIDEFLINYKVKL